MNSTTINFIINFISNYGFPIFASLCVMYVLYYIWKWVTINVKPVLSNINEHLNGVAEKVKNLEHDVEKLNQKVTIITILKSQGNEQAIKDVIGK